MASLTEYAAGERSRPSRCAICVSPLRAEIEAGRAKGVAYMTISRWLKAEHPDQAVSDSHLGRHFRERHHE